jgi:hypothetical protein
MHSHRPAADSFKPHAKRASHMPERRMGDFWLAARKLDPAPDAEVECGAMTAVDGSHRWRKESTK